MGRNALRNGKNMNREDLIDFETRIKAIWEAGDLPCLLHLSGGNEGQLLNIFQDIKPGDWVFSTHRNHYHALLAGISPDTLEQRIRDGGSMFVYSREHNFLCSAVLAGTCCIAAGVAWAIKEAGEKSRVWCFVGDGAVENGHAWEAFHFVEGHDLPCTFVIEDNNRSVDTDCASRRGPRDAINKALETFKCVRRYEYSPTFPHAGAATKFQIVFKPEAIKRMQPNGKD